MAAWFLDQSPVFAQGAISFAQEMAPIVAPIRIDDVAPFAVAIVAIVGGIGLAMVGTFLRHRERMAMIAHGMHPDNASDRAKYQAAKKGGGKEGWTDYQPPA